MMNPEYKQEEPTPFLRWRRAFGLPSIGKLEQRWEIKTIDDGEVVDVEYEWREVEEVND